VHHHHVWLLEPGLDRLYPDVEVICFYSSYLLPLQMQGPWPLTCLLTLSSFLHTTHDLLLLFFRS
jgi:hypothetical protein